MYDWQAKMLSEDGRCKTFDASADGYSRGEGCGSIFLEATALLVPYHMHTDPSATRVHNGMLKLVLRPWRPCILRLFILHILCEPLLVESFGRNLAKALLRYVRHNPFIPQVAYQDLHMPLPRSFLHMLLQNSHLSMPIARY